MVTLASLPADDATRRLRQGSLSLEIGPFVFRMRSTVPDLAARVFAHYANFPVVPANAFADYHVRVDARNPLRRFIHSNVSFWVDESIPFNPLPRAHAYALLESGMNWCVAHQAHTHLVIHAAVIARGNRAVVMPAPPGSGKSTLCAGLVNRGWRLLSDELALIRFEDGLIAPSPRPVSLKNESIEVIRRFAPDALLLHTADESIKGTVSHMTPPLDSVARAGEFAEPAWIVFPRYSAGSPSSLQPFGRGPAFMSLATNSFNYNITGTRGFELLAGVVDRSAALQFTYSDLDDAVRVFDDLASRS